MFANACQIVSKFTRPIIISIRRANGTCESVIGTGVMVNEDGWMLTAKHILDALKAFSENKLTYQKIIATRNQIESNSSLSTHQRRTQLDQNKIPPQIITHFHVWCGWPDTEVLHALALPNIDLGALKISNFNADSITQYPKFKNPKQPMLIGTSLCKMGYPFHSVHPQFNEVENTFDIAAGAMYPPYFPIDGIFTRLIATPVQTQGYPSWLIETSTPGLRGQSGGPTFDIYGNVWAIQSSTTHHPLGFDAGNNKTITPKESEHLKNQYLNVGIGIHSATLVGFMTENNIKFDLS